MMTIKQPTRRTLAAALLLVAASGASAQIALDLVHIDLKFKIELDTLGAVSGTEMELEDHTNESDYAPGDAFVAVNASTLGALPTHAAFGAQSGVAAWILPLSPIAPPSPPPGTEFTHAWPGLAAELFDSAGDPTPFSAGDTVTWTLIGGVLPSPSASVFIWQPGATLGSVNLFFSGSGTSFAGAYGFPDLSLDDHDHFNYGFTEVGTYLLTFDVAGTVGGTAVNGTGTYRFEVIPEPSVGAAVIAALALGAAWLRRRR